MNESRTVSVSIPRSYPEVYDYLANPENFPRWSAFITQIRATETDWIAQTPTGEVRLSFAPRNPFGILDHHVTVNPELRVYVPLRVLKNGDGSEVIFTVFRLPGMSDAQYETDIGLVVADLANLKRVLERL